nr:MAG TPA: hypothetical protein [Caudoviricetes sp.]
MPVFLNYPLKEWAHNLNIRIPTNKVTTIKEIR